MWVFQKGGTKADKSQKGNKHKKYEKRNRSKKIYNTFDNILLFCLATEKTEKKKWDLFLFYFE